MIRHKYYWSGILYRSHPLNVGEYWSKIRGIWHAITRSDLCVSTNNPISRDEARKLMPEAFKK